MTVEAWSDIRNTDYSVSDQGRIASRKYGKLRMLKPCANSYGYMVVSISSGISRTLSVHALVAAEFLPPKPSPAHELNHRDGDKANNRADNLEWVTHGENVQHRFDVLGHRALRGEAQAMSKLTEEQVLEIRGRRLAGEFLKTIAADYGISRRTVGDIARGRRWAWLTRSTAAGSP